MDEASMLSKEISRDKVILLDQLGIGEFGRWSYGRMLAFIVYNIIILESWKV